MWFNQRFLVYITGTVGGSTENFRPTLEILSSSLICGNGSLIKCLCPVAGGLFEFRRCSVIKINIFLLHEVIQQSVRCHLICFKSVLIECPLQSAVCHDNRHLSQTWLDYCMEQKKYFVDTASKMDYYVKHFINCKTTHAIYRLECPQCKVFYIGRTKRRLQDRLAEHKYAIRVGDEDYPMARHYKTLHHGNPASLWVLIMFLPQSEKGTVLNS